MGQQFKASGIRVILQFQLLIFLCQILAFTVSEGQTTYTYQASYGWGLAKQQCECTGNLAILDTEAKQAQLLSDVTIPAGECAWIGASNWGTGKYRWIELPPNYGQSRAYGELLTNTYNNFLSGDVPEESSLRAVCIYSNGTWRTYKAANNKQGGQICEWTECRPGQYKAAVNTSNSKCPYVSAGVYKWDECVMCPDDKIKSVSGDDESLCLDVCGGTTNAPNIGKTACECAAGYYGSGNNCTACTGIRVKPSQGDAPGCDTECDPLTSQPNENHTDCVCNGGYYRDGSVCVLCTGNTIKTLAGNKPNCDADPPCDGSTTVPNAEHTSCVCLAGHKMLTDGSCSKDRSVTYNLERRDVEITDGLLSLQVVSLARCGAECAERYCAGFSFHKQTPDVGMCNMISTKNVTYQPLEGAEYYTKP